MKRMVLAAITLVGIQSCQQKNESPTTAISHISNAMSIENTKSSVNCKLTTPELQLRKATAIKELRDILLMKKELTNGFSYEFDGSDHNIDLLCEFIKTERQCCDFFNFQLSITNDNVINFDITGAEGVKDFIRTELEM